PPHKIATHYLAPYLGSEGRVVAAVGGGGIASSRGCALPGHNPPPPPPACPSPPPGTTCGWWAPAPTRTSGVTLNPESADAASVLMRASPQTHGPTHSPRPH